MADKKTAAERLADFMLKVGPDKSVDLSRTLIDLEIDIEADRFVLSDARTLLRTAHDGRTIMRKNNRLQLTRNAEETRVYELQNMHDRVEREVDRAQVHLEQVTPHLESAEERQRMHDSLVYVGSVRSVLSRSRERAEKKRLMFQKLRGNAPDEGSGE